MTRTRRDLLAAAGAGLAATLAGCTGRRASADAGGEEGDESGDPLSLLAIHAPRFAQQGEPFTVEFMVRNTGDRAVDLQTDFEVKEEDTWDVMTEVDTTVEPGEVATVEQSDRFFHFVSRRYRLAAFDKEVTVKTMCNCTHI